MKDIKSHLKRLHILPVVGLVAMIGRGCGQDTQDGDNRQPNVILILVDDMAYGDLSMNNGGLTRTPHLDQLAEAGVVFSQGYSASPVCAPARAALLTGLYPHQTGCVTLGMRRFPELTKLDKDLVTMADVFGSNGYATGLVGKWHCGEGEGYHPMDRGFQEFEGFMGYMINSYFDYQLDINRTILKSNDKYLTEDLTERAINFVRRHKDEPFFLHLAHYAPHRPLGAPEETIAYYRDKGFDENTATIYAMIEIMDRGIGQLLGELDKLGIRENTLLIFSSDNGPDPIPGERENLGLKGTKYTIYEGGIHVPFIVHWKDSIRPAQIDKVIHFTDVFPTLVEICDLNLNESIDFEGGSMAGLLRGKHGNQLPGARYWQWNRGVPVYSHNAAIRQGQWKLVRPFVTRNIPDGPSTEKAVLYNLEEDPFEKEDVSATNKRRYENMNVLLEKWCREMEFERLLNTK